MNSMSSCTVLLLVLMHVAISQRSIIDYDFVTERFQDIDTLEAFVDHTMYASGDSSPKTNILVGTYSSNGDPETLRNLYGFRLAARRFGEGVLDTLLVPESIISDILPARASDVSRDERVLFIPKGAPWNSAQEYKGELVEKDISAWTSTLYKSNLKIWNHSRFTVKVYWVDEGKEEQKIAELVTGTGTSSNTYIGHVFVVRKADDNQFLGYHIVNSAHDEYHLEDDEGFNPSETEFADKVNAHWLAMRYMKNYYQPNITPALTPVGFKKTRVPDELWNEILEFYSHNENKQRLESTIGPCVNQEVAPTYMIQMPGNLRQKIITQMKPILEEWSGLQLRMTSLYGIRKYTRDSELRMHVDTLDTHVISCIVNVAQEVEEDWLLEILDHDGKLHKIAMQPGDLVLYESAKALHGRPEPLKGNLYSNFFLHYSPIDYPWDFTGY